MTPPRESDLGTRIPRKFGRIKVDSAAILALPARNAHPRVKAHLVQIAKGGCAVTTDERMFIGEDCLVWGCGGGHKYLGVPGRIVWIKTIYEGHEKNVVGIEFTKPIELSAELLRALGAK